MPPLKLDYRNEEKSAEIEVDGSLMAQDLGPTADTLKLSIQERSIFAE